MVVASILIWQMTIQKKTLDIAHKDADAQLSLDSVKSRRDFLYKQLDNNDLKELFQNKEKYKDCSHCKTYDLWPYSTTIIVIFV